jgi:nucleotide-binding universal stress UspA family protein
VLCERSKNLKRFHDNKGSCRVLISKILVGFDGTKCSEKALEFGLDLAEKYSAELMILNVLELPVYGSPDDSFSTSAGMVGFVKDLRKLHQGIVSRGSEKAGKLKPGVKVVTELREGSPPEQIVLAAKEGGFDVVVVGHGGESRLREMFLGGTSERVAHLASCPVIIVK